MTNTFASDDVWHPEDRGFSMGLVQPPGRIVHLMGHVAWDADSNHIGLGMFAFKHTMFRNIECLLRKLRGNLMGHCHFQFV